MRSRLLQAVVAVVAVLVLGLLLWAGTDTDPPASRPGTSAAPAPTTPPATDPGSGLPVVALSALPAEAQQTVRLIDRGGPFPYARDGATFGNRERRLPAQRSGFYREYTVPTPGEDDRGARRIVAGDDGRLLYWTADHYTSFARVQR